MLMTCCHCSSLEHRLYPPHQIGRQHWALLHWKTAQNIHACHQLPLLVLYVINYKWRQLKPTKVQEEVIQKPILAKGSSVYRYLELCSHLLSQKQLQIYHCSKYPLLFRSLERNFIIISILALKMQVTLFSPKLVNKTLIRQSFSRSLI